MSGGPLLVARTELRRSVRAVSNERTKLFVLGLLAALFGGSVLAAGGYLLPRLGQELAAGVTPSEVTLATGLVTGSIAVAWIVLTLMAVFRTFAASDPDEPAFLLVSTSVRNAVGGIVLAETVRFALWVLPPVTLLAVAFAYGAGTLLPIVLGPLVVALLVVTAIPVGFVVGTAIRHLVTVYEPIARYRTILFVGFWAAYFGAIATGRFDLLTSRLFAVVQDSPLGWPGHLLLVGVPNVPASQLAVLGTVVVTSLVATAGFAGAIGAARIHWLADPARFDDATESTPAQRSSRLAGALDRGLSRPVRTVAVTAIRRTKRAPIRLAYVGYPLLGSVAFVQQIVHTGTVPAHIAVILSVYVVWAAGALFTLNPLGDLGRGLPAVLASPLSGRQATSGLVIAGALVAAPIAFLASLTLGLVSPLSIEHTAVLVAATTVGSIATPALATGIGTAAPRFGSVSITNNREAVMPSKTAFMIYSAAVILPAIAAVVLYTDSAAVIADLFTAIAAVVPGPEASVSARGVSIAAWSVLSVGLLAPLVSVLFAIEAFDLYTIE